MSFAPASVYRSLAPESRKNLIAHCCPGLMSGASLPDELTELGLTETQSNVVVEYLQKISLLGADEMGDVVRQMLAEGGWREEDFKASLSGRDRACALLALDAEAFEAAVRIFNGNRLWGREKRENGFRLPEFADMPDSGELPDGPLDTQTRLYCLIEQVLGEVMAGQQLVEVTVLRRAGLGLPAVSPEILQCDIAVGADPVSVEINEDGAAQTLSLSFLSRIAVMMDAAGGALFVGCESQSGKLRRELAQVFLQALFGTGGAPVPLAPLRVDTEALRRRPDFVTQTADRLESVRVSQIWYRKGSEPFAIQRSLRSDSGAVCLYSLPELQSGADDLHIYRAAIEFLFKPAGRKREPVKRTVMLNGPGSIAYQKAFPGQRRAINRVLQQAGLLSGTGEPITRACLADLYRFRTPQHLAEVEASWPATQLEALRQAKILTDGPQAERAWCPECGQTHEIEDAVSEELIVLCPIERRPLQEDETRTLQLDWSGLARWLVTSAATDQTAPKDLGAYSWFVGALTLGRKQGRYGLILMADSEDAASIRTINAYLDARPRLSQGVILTAGPAPHPAGFRKGWVLLPVAEVTGIEAGKLSLDPDAIEAAILGKRVRTRTGSKADLWTRFFETYQETRTGLGHYPEADRMLQDHPGVCPAGRDQLARRLKQAFPEDFPD